jgi:hypothetical protein
MASRKSGWFGLGASELVSGSVFKTSEACSANRDRVLCTSWRRDRNRGQSAGLGASSSVRGPPFVRRAAHTIMACERFR